MTFDELLRQAERLFEQGDIVTVVILLAIALVVALTAKAKTTGFSGRLLNPVGPGQTLIFDENVQRMTEAIAKAEGFGVSGAIPTVRNNPGNLKLPSSGREITTFATAAEGWEALRRQIRLIASGDSRFYTVQMTLAEMGHVWADGANDPVGARNWTRNVSRALGLPETATIGQVLAV